MSDTDIGTNVSLEDVSAEELEQARAILAKVRASAKKGGIPEGTEWAKAHSMLRLMHPSQYGFHSEKYLREFYGWDEVHKSLSCGDAEDSDGNRWEIKVSLMGGENPTANFVQIRATENIAGFQLFAVEEDGTVNRFILTQEQMLEELAMCGGCAHGKNFEGSVEAGAEQAIRISWGASRTGSIYSRWMDRYLDNSNVPA